MCRPFMNGATFSRWTHTMSVLAPTSTMPKAKPITNRIANNTASVVVMGTSAIIAAMSTSTAARIGCPATRSYTNPPASVPKM